MYARLRANAKDPQTFDKAFSGLHRLVKSVVNRDPVELTPEVSPGIHAYIQFFANNKLSWLRELNPVSTFSVRITAKKNIRIFIVNKKKLQNSYFRANKHGLFDASVAMNLTLYSLIVPNTDATHQTTIIPNKQRNGSLMKKNSVKKTFTY